MPASLSIEAGNGLSRGLLCSVPNECALDFISRHFLVDQFGHDRAGYLIGNFANGRMPVRACVPPNATPDLRACITACGPLWRASG